MIRTKVQRSIRRRERIHLWTLTPHRHRSLQYAVWTGGKRKEQSYVRSARVLRLASTLIGRFACRPGDPAQAVLVHHSNMIFLLSMMADADAHRQSTVAGPNAAEKPVWHRQLALECLLYYFVQPEIPDQLLNLFSMCYGAELPPPLTPTPEPQPGAESEAASLSAASGEAQEEGSEAISASRAPAALSDNVVERLMMSLESNITAASTGKISAEVGPPPPLFPLLFLSLVPPPSAPTSPPPSFPPSLPWFPCFFASNSILPFEMQRGPQVLSLSFLLRKSTRTSQHSSNNPPTPPQIVSKDLEQIRRTDPTHLLLGQQQPTVPSSIVSQEMCANISMTCIAQAAAAAAKLSGVSCQLSSTSPAYSLQRGKMHIDVSIRSVNSTPVLQMLHTLMRPLKCSLTGPNSATLTTKLLGTYELFIRSCCALSQTVLCDRLMAAMCDAAIPSTPPGAAIHNMPLCKMLVQLAFRMPHDLGSGWAHIFTLLQRIKAAADAAGEKNPPKTLNDAARTKYRDAADSTFCS